LQRILRVTPRDAAALRAMPPRRRR
jgi:hypothetical protein